MTIDNYLQPLARLLLAAIFVVSGFGKVAAFDQTVALMQQVGFPIATAALVMAIVTEIVGGFALLLGYHTRVAALGLVALLIPATVVFHVLPMANPATAQDAMVHTLKNLAIIGGLLKMASDGAGALSLDAARPTSAEAGAAFATRA